VILCLCPSPAIDVTYQVAALEVGGTTRVRHVAHRPGGKAVNVARVLTTLGEPAVVLAPIGGDSGKRFQTDLTALGVRTETVHSGHPTRRTVTVVEAANGRASVLTEPSRVDCWNALVDRFSELLPDAAAVVLSGSLPEGAGSLTELVRAGRVAGIPVVVDTSGAALADALAGRPAVVKPNAHELAELTGEPDALTAAKEVAARHHTPVVASLGSDGVIAIDGPDAWRARPARPLKGNPTGAGDALVAGLARGLAQGAALPDVLGDAVALSAAAVVQPYAGEVDLAEVDRQRAGVRIEQLEADR
jgi:tagatose 6-phosphate kinase